MCFSKNISLIIGTMGLISSTYFKNKYASIGIFYFALMEILQFFQYMVIDKCKNKYNKFLTIIGYIHICFQPLFFNIWLYAFMKKPNFIFLYLFFVAGLLMASRLLFVKDDELCDIHNEPLCGKQTCAKSGNKHIAWDVRLRAPGVGWFTPSIGLHFFLWVIPVLISFELKPILAMLLTGPYLGILLTKNKNEQPSIWCYTVISQMILTYYYLK